MNRSEKILDYLETALTVSRDDLARMSGVSVRSIENDIKALNVKLEPAARIILDEAFRYRLVVLDPQKHKAETIFDRQGNRTLNDTVRRQAYIFESLLLADGPLTLEELAEDLRVGRSTAVSDLAKMRSMLSSFDIKVKARPKVGYWLDGKEISIRHAILDLYFEDIYSEGSTVWLRELITQVAQKYQMSQDTSERLERWLTVQVDRVQNGHVLTELPESYDALVDSTAYKSAKELLISAKQWLPKSLPEMETVFLTLPLSVVRTQLDSLGGHEQKISPEDQDLVDTIMARIRNEMGLTLIVGDLALLEKFVQHVAFLINRMRFQIRLGSNSLGARATYPVAFRMAEIAKDVIETERGGQVADEELDFIAAYFEVFLRDQKIRMPQNIRVAIVAPMATVSTRLLRMRLEELVSDVVEFSTLSSENPQTEDLAGFDLVVASPQANVVTDLPVIRLREDFDHQEFVNWIRRARAHKQWGARLTGLDDMLAALVSPEQFYVLPSLQSYEENLDAMLDNLVNRGLITADVQQGVKDREELRTTRLEGSVAFPHLSHPEIGDLVFAVGATKREPEDPDVRLIFLLLLPEDVGGYDDLLVQLYDEIIRMAADQEQVKKVSSSTSFHDYLLHFLRGRSL